MRTLFGDDPQVAPVAPLVRDERVPQNVWLVQQARSREQRKGRYVEDIFHSQKMAPELARQCLRHLRLPMGAVVHDSFTGTGTTLAEAVEMGYAVSGCDIVPGFIEKGAKPNIELAQQRSGYRLPVDVRVGSAIQLSWIPDQSIDAGVCSPAYGDCDPSRDSNGRTILERAAAGEAYASFALRTSAYRFDATALEMPGAMGNMTLDEWEAMMFLALREYRRVLKHDGFLLIAVREFFRRKSALDLVDLPGRVMELGIRAKLKPYDIIYALDCCLEDDGALKSRGSLHQNRLARKMAGRPCPRGVPAVTRVLILQRRVRKKPRRPHEDRRVPAEPVVQGPRGGEEDLRGAPGAGVRPELAVPGTLAEREEPAQGDGAGAVPKGHLGGVEPGCNGAVVGPEAGREPRAHPEGPRDAEP